MANEATLLVGVDVGMTCTGVAWAVKNRNVQMTDPHVIQKWPGNAGAQSDKVPTVVSYSNTSLSAWGFIATRAQEDLDNPSDVHEWFKIYLDPEEYDRSRRKAPDSVPKSHQDVRRFYKDFLGKLCVEIERQLEGRIGSEWQRANIEFLFSVPTTWTAIGVTKDFERLVREAGFGKGGSNHRATISLTEAEAAAVHTFKAGAISYSDGDIMLIVDAGGGTTDLALLRANVKEGQQPTLQQLDVVRGDEIGSVLIDLAFQEIAANRLRVVQGRLRRSADDIAFEMIRASFAVVKEEFGTDHSDSQNIKLLQIPGLSDEFDAPEAGIKRGKMRFTNADVQALFDVQVREIFKLMDHQLYRMGQIAKGSEITHIVLSGGLGSSEYVKKQLKERYCHPQAPSPCAKGLMIATSDAPQLAVVKGLVQDRIQKLEVRPGALGVGVLASRICRMSLGIVCLQKYNPTLHRGQKVIEDEIDGKKYVTKRINWFIKQGESISEETIARPFFRNLQESDPRKLWIDEICISHLEKDLPNSMHEDGAKPLCQMKSDLTLIPLTSFEKKKRKPWWHSRKNPNNKPHYKARYEIRFQLRPAAIDFELWFDGKKFNDEQHFDVEWEEGAHLSSPRSLRHGRESLDGSRWDVR